MLDGGGNGAGSGQHRSALLPLRRFASSDSGPCWAREVDPDLPRVPSVGAGSRRIWLAEAVGAFVRAQGPARTDHRRQQGKMQSDFRCHAQVDGGQSGGDAFGGRRGDDGGAGAVWGQDDGGVCALAGQGDGLADGGAGVGVDDGQVGVGGVGGWQQGAGSGGVVGQRVELAGDGDRGGGQSEAGGGVEDNHGGGARGGGRGGRAFGDDVGALKAWVVLHRVQLPVEH